MCVHVYVARVPVSGIHYKKYNPNTPYSVVAIVTVSDLLYAVSASRLKSKTILHVIFTMKLILINIC